MIEFRLHSDSIKMSLRFFMDSVNKKNAKCKYFYWHIINKTKHRPTAIDNWEETFNDFRQADQNI